jgi:hypothetical protein
MSEFYVHWNTIVRKLRIHRGVCGACNYGQGMHKGKIKAGRGSTYDWEAADSYAHACEIVEALKRSKPVLKKSTKIECGLCHPRRNG